MKSTTTSKPLKRSASYSAVTCKAIAAFTLPELCVAVTIFALLLSLLSGLITQVTKTWQRSESQIARQQTLRLVLDRISRDMEGALFPTKPGELSSFQFLVNPGILSTTENPTAAFWQTSRSGRQGDVVEVGYFVRFQTYAGRPGFRSQLCRLEAPGSATDSIYYQPARWLTPEKIRTYVPEIPDESNPMKGILAENVVGLWITPFHQDEPLPLPYDSRAELRRPTSVEVAVAVIDPGVANRLDGVAEITDHYSATPGEFINQLDEKIRDAVSILKSRIHLANSTLLRE